MKNLLLLLLLSGTAALSAQPEYYMNNQTVDDCEGFLYDSEAGDVGGNYDHNENFTFSICIPEADQIVMTFFSFCTEADFDSLRIFDGPDTLSMQIGPTYTGETDPPQIIATSGCLTLNFISDPSVSCSGWYAYWETIVEIPDPPDILPLADLPCESNSITLTFDEQIPCDSIYPGAFSITGAQLPTVTAATPSTCSGGITNTVTLTFNPPIDFSGDYLVTFTNSVTVCETVYTLVAMEPFSVTDCPLNVVILNDSSEACLGQSITLYAEASGGDPNTYMFNWMPGASNVDSVVVSPLGPTTYLVVVTDANGATASDTITLFPFPLPQINMSDTSFCQSVDPFFLTATPSGGTWTGDGIEEGQETTGWYDPSLVSDLTDVVTYTDLNGCSNSITIQLEALDPGLDQAACPGAPPFMVSGGFPVGGTWSGPNITPAGLFDPVAVGSYDVIYTHPNGCAGTKTINVGAIQVPPVDSICQSVAAFELMVQPFGGIWSGPGIVDSFTGLFDPNEAGGGTHQLVYEIVGCSDTIDLFVITIDALWSLNACPYQDPFVLPGNWQPQGLGIWSGLGIVDPVTGLYDPDLPNSTNDTLTFTANGCVDTRVVFIRETKIGIEQLEFCPEDDALILNFETVNRVPFGGSWSGPGITNPVDIDFYFNPDLAGPGTHTLIYTQNTCTDSMTMIVHPSPNIPPVTLCEVADPVILIVDPIGGTWSGNGITNTTLGFFDPAVAGVGSHPVYNESIEGCTGEGLVTVTPLAEAEIEGLESFYCFQDTTIFPILSPPGGTLLVDGMAVSSFNPALAGPGSHLIQYSIGVDACEDTQTIGVEVGQPIAITLPFELDSICSGETVTLTAAASGGNSFGNFTYTWDQGLGFGQNHQVQPLVPTTYTVTASDGCSDPGTGSITLYVHPEFFPTYITGPAVCFDDTTFATVSASPGNNYSYVWDTDPPTVGAYLESYPTSYIVEVTDNETGCQKELEVQLPGYPLIKANFGIAPNEECVTTIDPTIQILDFSVGGLEGYWDFGDGYAGHPYFLGENLTHTYQDTGHFTISLFIENEGGCFSEFQQEICVEYANRLYAPNAFSPNGDGINDIFKFVGFGIESISWQVFNRYGEMLYQADDLDEVWDGIYKGNRVPQGVYTVMASYVQQGKPGKFAYQGFVTVLH